MLVHTGSALLPRDVRVLVLARSVNRLGAFSLPFLSIELTREMHASLPVVGLVIAGFGLASMASRLLGGWLADHWGRRTTMVTGLAACGVAQLAIAGARTLPEAAAAVVALGLAFEIYESPCQALVADSVDARNRASAFGLLGASLSVAGLGAGLIATAVAPVSLRMLFVVDSATCLLAAALLLRLLHSDTRERRRVIGTDVGRSPWRSPLLVFLFVANVVFAACYFQVGISLPLTLQHRGVPASGYGVVLVTSSVAVIASQPLLRLRRRGRGPGQGSHSTPIVVGYLLLALGLAGYGEAHSLAGFLSATSIGAVGEVFLAGHVLALVSGLAPETRRGRYLGAFGLSWGVAATLGPVPGTLLLAHFGDQTLWFVCATCCAAVGAAHAVALRSHLARSGQVAARG